MGVMVCGVSSPPGRVARHASMGGAIGGGPGQVHAPGREILVGQPEANGADSSKRTLPDPADGDRQRSLRAENVFGDRIGIPEAFEGNRGDGYGQAQIRRQRGTPEVMMHVC